MRRRVLCRNDQSRDLQKFDAIFSENRWLRHNFRIKTRRLHHIRSLCGQNHSLSGKIAGFFKQNSQTKTPTQSRGFKSKAQSTHRAVHSSRDLFVIAPFVIAIKIVAMFAFTSITPITAWIRERIVKIRWWSRTKVTVYAITGITAGWTVTKIAAWATIVIAATIAKITAWRTILMVAARAAIIIATTITEITTRSSITIIAAWTTIILATAITEIAPRPWLRRFNRLSIQLEIAGGHPAAPILNQFIENRLSFR
jgi:hypothetical protein